MMKNILAVFFVCIITVLKIHAQTCADKYWGTKTIYQPQQKKYAPIPKGYQPVYINYVGRHGARHLTKDVGGTFAYKLLHQADSATALAAAGYRLKNMVDLLQKIEQPVLKSISIRGAEEQQGIGQRMLQRNGNIFKAGYKVTVTITKEERTKQSAKALLKGLKYPATVDEAVDNDMLRFFSIAPAYLDYENNGNWKLQMEKLEKSIKPVNFDEKVLSRFFVRPFLDKISIEQQDEFIDDIFGFSSITNSIQQEITNAGYLPAQLNFRSFINCDELYVLNRLNCADDFLKKGPALNGGH